MNISRRTAFALLAAAAFWPALAVSASAQTPEEIKAKGTLTVGMLVDFPPFGIMNAENQPDGYDADVAKLLAEDLGVHGHHRAGHRPEPHPLSAERPGRRARRLARHHRGARRARRLLAALCRHRHRRLSASPTWTSSTPEKLSGHTIGVARASTQDTAVTKVAPADATIQRFDDDASAVQALLAGQVEAIGVSNVVIIQIEQVAPDRFDAEVRPEPAGPGHCRPSGLRRAARRDQRLPRARPRPTASSTRSTRSGSARRCPTSSQAAN